MKTRNEREEELKRKLKADLGIWELRAILINYMGIADVVPIQIGDDLLIKTILDYEYRRDGSPPS